MKTIPPWLKKKKIAVLYGGWSIESKISRLTGLAILQALKELKLNVVGMELDKNLSKKLTAQKIGYCFIALHGRPGEDGTVQGLCDLMNIPYSGSGVLASALSMNKFYSKLIFEKNSINTPSYQVTNGMSPLGKVQLPCVIKPVEGGSAYGVTIVRNRSKVRSAVSNALKYSSSALIEKFIKGNEFTAAVLGNRVLPVVEIIPKNSFYDYSSKYVKGMSQHRIPARISKKTYRIICEMALMAHKALNLKAYSRADFIVDKQGRPWILEVNSIPGMTETSLFPDAAKAAGISFKDCVMEILISSKG